ncbi:S-layer homology domain-containing protein [Leptolyngbya sp. AN02str]|uniref:S-layer homology domain-containing protein n=1 Tax=Leptolyngbya sp. AN02str TaxID=3423363 RepID=UPI003D31F0C2
MGNRTLLMTMAIWGFGLASSAAAFTDITGHWAQTCVTQLRARGTISGYPDNTFRPNAAVSRAEYAAFMLTAFPTVDHWLSAPTAPTALQNPGFSYWYYDPQRPEDERNSPYSWTPQPVDFVDVSPSHWAYNAVRKAGGRRMFVGYPDRTFQPNQLIPRVQAIAVLAKEMRYGEADNSEAVLARYFDDAADIPTYATRAIATATLGRLAVNGPNVRQFRPNQNTTRAEVAALLCQALGLARTVPLNYIAAGDQFVIPPEAGGRRPFAEGLAVAEVNGKYGYIDLQGNLVIPAQYDQATDFQGGIAQVSRNAQVEFIDRTGALVQPPPGYRPASEDIDLMSPANGPWLRRFSGRTIEYISGIGGGQIPEYDTTTVSGIWGYTNRP